MILQDTVPIIFNGGAYGTYLEYLLDTFTLQGTRNFQGLPFRNNGNAHQYTGKHLINMAGWRNYTSSNSFCKFVRLHPKTHKDELLEQNITEILTITDRAILIYPTESTTILNLNNYYFKVWSSWLAQQFEFEISLDKIYNNWPVEPGTLIDQIPNWIIREFLSVYLVPAWRAQIEWNFLENFSHPKLLIITLPELLFNINYTVNRVRDFCNLDLVPGAPIEDIHQTMLSYQKNLHKDELCNKIIQCTIDCTNFDYSNETLTIVDESYIQWQLRNLGFEIQCNNLNQFPTSTTELSNKIYRT